MKSLNPSGKTQRYALVDDIRGTAVLLMIVFHLGYDLELLKLTTLNLKSYTAWRLLPYLIVTLFLLAVGMSLVLSHHPAIQWKKFTRRIIKLSICALAVSIATYLAIPEHWVYFGTLHNIALCSVLSLAFLGRPKTALGGGGAMLFCSLALDLEIPWWQLPHSSMDYIPPFPWWGVALVGIYLVHQRQYLKYPSKSPLPLVNTLGRHALIIYMLHQPILLGTLHAMRHLIVMAN